jgi:thioredoxin reductase (NADPH)
MSDNKYQVIIIGGGPAGLTAGLYTARAGLKSLMIEGGIIGGKMIEAWLLENYPGFPDAINGFDLSLLMHQQSTKFGMETLNATVSSIEFKGKKKLVNVDDAQYEADALIITGGSERVKLNVPGEKEYTGKGVSYCSTCDAPLFKGKEVAVVGGGNVAITEALHLAGFASKVTVIHRRDKLRATKVVQDRAFAEPKLKFVWDSVVEAVEGSDFVERLKLRNVKTDKTSDLKVGGLFVSIGLRPNTEYLKDIVELDKIGQVVVNARMETSAPGVFAAGDIRADSIRQVIAAAGDGAVAAVSAHQFLSE